MYPSLGGALEPSHAGVERQGSRVWSVREHGQGAAHLLTLGLHTRLLRQLPFEVAHACIRPQTDHVLLACPLDTQLHGRRHSTLTPARHASFTGVPQPPARCAGRARSYTRLRWCPNLAKRTALQASYTGVEACRAFPPNEVPYSALPKRRTWFQGLELSGRRGRSGVTTTVVV